MVFCKSGLCHFTKPWDFAYGTQSYDTTLLKVYSGGSSDTLLFSMMRSSVQRNGRCIYLHQKCQEFKISVVNKTDQVITGRGSLSESVPTSCKPFWLRKGWPSSRAGSLRILSEPIAVRWMMNSDGILHLGWVLRRSSGGCGRTPSAQWSKWTVLPQWTFKEQEMTKSVNQGTGSIPVHSTTTAGIPPSVKLETHQAWKMHIAQTACGCNRSQLHVKCMQGQADSHVAVLLT